VTLLLALGACAPQPAPAIETTPSLVPVNLAGPEMTVGSTWLYADGTVLVPVPAGIFTMGGGKTDNPAHPVNLPDFWIYRTKVTNIQYAYCVELGGCTSPSKTENPGYGDSLHANDPVVGVDHTQAGDYCEFVHARLPTEAEWEKMARGTDAQIYPWGGAAPNCDLLNYESCKGGTTPVNAYPQGQSPYHAFDAEGNTFEWVADWYKADYYASAPPDDPQGPTGGQARSVRSSAFNSGANQTQTYNRFYSRPADQRANLGFRCVVEDPTYFSPFCEYPATYGTDGIGGTTAGEQSKVDCPVISIHQSPYCQGDKPKTIVEFEISFDQPLYSLTYDVPQSCGFGLSNLKWDCSEVSPGQGSGGQPLIFCSYCIVTPASSTPQCPSGYTYDDLTHNCLSDSDSDISGTGACLPGFTLDTTAQCCKFSPPEVTNPSTDSNLICDYLTEGSPVVTCHPPFPSCPAGTYFTGHECISNVFPKFCITEALTFNSCTPGGGGCAPPAGGCGTNYAWDSNLCECVCDGC
jgi:iron(II)-dependent oxidoreductase